MSIVNMRLLSNSPSAKQFNESDSTLDSIIFSEDINKIRDALMTAKYGIKTKSVEITEDLSVIGNEVVDGTLTVAGTVNAEGNLSVSGTSSFADNVTIASGKTVDGVDVSKLSELSTELQGGLIPLKLILGAQTSPEATWNSHDHSGDGSAQIGTGGIANAAITSTKLDSSVFGTTSTTAFRGDVGAAFRTGVQTIYNPGANDFPGGATFVSPFQMGAATVAGNNADSGAFFSIVSNPFMSATFLYNAAVKLTTTNGARFVDCIRSDYSTINLRFVYGFDDSSPSPSNTHTLIGTYSAIPLNTALDDLSPTDQGDDFSVTLSSGSDIKVGDRIYMSNPVTVNIPTSGGNPASALLGVRFIGGSLPQVHLWYIFGVVIDKGIKVT